MVWLNWIGLGRVGLYWVRLSREVLGKVGFKDPRRSGLYRTML